MLNLKNVSREDLYSVPLPNPTESYVPISNKRLITTLDTMVRDHGLKIEREEFSTTKTGQVMIGKIQLVTPDSPEIGMMMAVGNSYNKMRRVSVASGAVVFACLNGMFRGEYVKMRKHTGTISDDLESMIDSALVTIGGNFVELVKDAELMKGYQIDRKVAAELLGDMYINYQIMNSVQLNLVKKQMKFSENFRMVEPSEFTLWNLYNNVTESLKSSHPLNYVSAHRNLHSYVTRFMGEQETSDYDLMTQEFEEMEELIENED